MGVPACFSFATSASMSLTRRTIVAVPGSWIRKCAGERSISVNSRNSDRQPLPGYGT